MTRTKIFDPIIAVRKCGSLQLMARFLSIADWADIQFNPLRTWAIPAPCKDLVLWVN